MGMERGWQWINRIGIVLKVGMREGAQLRVRDLINRKDLPPLKPGDFPPPFLDFPLSLTALAPPFLAFHCLSLTFRGISSPPY